MQRAEYEMAGLRGGQRQPDRLEVAHFADEDDVGVLAQGRTKRLAESERIAMNLALVDQRLLALVHELDRILDRNDVIGLVVVHIVDHARKRRRLTRAGRTRNENEAARMHRDVFEDARRAEIV